MDYQVGNRVRCIRAYERSNIVGMVGTVVRIEQHLHGRVEGPLLGVEFDEPMGGHRCSTENVKAGHGWHIPADYLEPEEPLYGPPCPESIVQERKVKEKARITWNKSQFIVKYPHLAY